ncbi:hypothetical protein I4F81_004301 [Pyropia yezoensis]|uniref:Uncharacterized protein n=1 Tax=Pyropia yezoensis TaxID=2788 RepID=A0ACC3BUL1_PYRYE|nr:hypothetical protein I4F81_004301 [Neopyropia yezoensis]
MKKRIVRPPMLQLPDCPAVKARASVAKTEDEVAGDGALWGVTLRRGRRRARAAQYASKRLPERFVALRKAGACLTDALRQAFIDTDTEYSGTLTVAHAGDTRAVLAVVGGGAVRLSVDHRPSRPDELARIEASGGLVLTSSGTARVNGILAVSRSLGDRDLKAFVIADPEVATRPLTPVDEFVVVASDGVWDVLSDEAAVAAVGGALAGGCAPTAAASVLVRLAYSMGSKDDISALVVDLRVYAQQGWRATAGTPGVARGSVAALPIEEEKGARGWRAAATAKDGGPSPDGVADTARLTSPGR